MPSGRASIGCAGGAAAAYAAALASVIHDYQRAQGSACPDGAAAPLLFWPLAALAVVLAFVSFAIRPGRDGGDGKGSGADSVAFIAVVAVPLATLALILGYQFTYACWE
jgi:hypothetical protein